MQRVLSRQIFTTKIFFVVNWEQRPSSASCQRHELPSYLPSTKDSASSLPFRTFPWAMKYQNEGSPTVSGRLLERGNRHNAIFLDSQTCLVYTALHGRALSTAQHG